MTFTAITGPMFSGKTSDLLKRFQSEPHPNNYLFKPAYDTRYALDSVVSHDSNNSLAFSCNNGSEIEQILNEETGNNIFIDELQLFGGDIVDTISRLKRGNDIYGTFLNYDFKGGPMKLLDSNRTVMDFLTLADNVTNHYASCVECNTPASYTHRKVNDTSEHLLGASDIYEPRCFYHFFPVVTENL